MIREKSPWQGEERFDTFRNFASIPYVQSALLFHRTLSPCRPVSKPLVKMRLLSSIIAILPPVPGDFLSVDTALLSRLTVPVFLIA